jgi:hypothetical protein
MTPLEQAARAAQHAPSVFNTQPWSWRITGESMDPPRPAPRLASTAARRSDTAKTPRRDLAMSSPSWSR